MPQPFPKGGSTQHPPWYGKYRPEVGYSCLLIEDQTLLDTAVQQFSTQFDVVVVHSHRVHYVTYFWYQQSDPKATNKTMPSHHQSAEQWLTQLTRMCNCTPTKRPHQAEGDQTKGTYIQEEQQKKQPRISSQSAHPVQPYNLVSLPKLFNEGNQQLTNTQRTELQQPKT